MLNQLKKYIREGKLTEIKNILPNNRHILTVKDDYGDLLMHYAAKNYSKDRIDIIDAIAEFLPDAAENLNIIGSGGNTIYHIAVKRDIKILIDSIIVNGGDKSIKNNDGKTPLECRAEYIDDSSRFWSCGKARQNKSIEKSFVYMIGDRIKNSFVDIIEKERNQSLDPGCSIN